MELNESGSLTSQHKITLERLTHHLNQLYGTIEFIELWQS